MTTDISTTGSTTNSTTASTHRELSTGTVILTIVGAVAILVSGWVHFYLYVRGGYRGIAPESFLGITVSRGFALNAIAGVVIAEALVLATRF